MELRPIKTDDVFVYLCLVRKVREHSQSVCRMHFHTSCHLVRKRMAFLRWCGKVSESWALPNNTEMRFVTAVSNTSLSLYHCRIMCCSFAWQSFSGPHSDVVFFHACLADGIGINPAQTAGELFCCFVAHVLENLLKATFSTKTKMTF